MIALLSLGLVCGLVLGCYGLFRRFLWARRSPGEPLQAILRPAVAELQFWSAGLIVVVLLMIILVLDPLAFSSGGWALLLAFAPAVFEVACWASGLYQYAFYENGLWYGRTWYPFRDLQSYEIDLDRVRLVARGRVISFRTEGALAPEIRLKLAVEGFS